MRLVSRMRRPLREIRRPPQHGSALLQLPTEVALLVAENLPRYSLHILAQCCTDLRRLIMAHFRIRNESYRFTWLDRIDYCFCMARERLDVWVCSGCSKLHRVSYEDIPRTLVEGITGSCRFFGLLQNISGDLCHDGSRLFYIHEAHVQLALKYTRLQDRLNDLQRAYLRTLLLDRTKRLTERYDSPTSSTGVYCTIKILVPRGHFLLYIGYWQQHAVSSAAEWHQKVIDSSCMHQSDPATKFAMLPGGMPGRTDRSMDEQSGSCRHCATDVSVLTGRVTGRTFVRIWKDLGTEVPQTHPEWMGRIATTFRHPNEYGSARALYEATIGGETPRTGHHAVTAQPG